MKILLLLGFVFCLGVSPFAQAQYYSREDSLLDRANGLRWEATSLQQRTAELQRAHASTQVWKFQVDDWARRTHAQAGVLAQQSKQVDRAAFFNNQVAAINQANAEQIRQQGAAVFAAGQQVALRTQSIINFEHQLWQWKTMLDTQDAQIKANLDGKSAAHDTSAAALTADNVRLDAIMKSNQVLRAANKQRSDQLDKLVANTLARSQAVTKRKQIQDEAWASAKTAREECEALSAELDRLEKSLDQQAGGTKTPTGTTK